MLPEQLLWGAVPPGFDKLTDGKGIHMIVRQGLEGALDFSICHGDGQKTTESRYQGRGMLRTITLSGGEAALIRGYRHGGFFRAVTGSWFVTWPPRPFRELSITEELRRRGIRTVEVYGACVSRGVGPFYRGWLITKQLPEAEDLWSALRGGFVRRFGLDSTLRAVAESIWAMHAQGVYHQDLNLKNILVRPEAGHVGGYIIDFDKAKLFLGKLPAPLVKRNLDRLWRSVRKLDPEQKFLSAPAWQQLVGFYHDAANRHV